MCVGVGDRCETDMFHCFYKCANVLVGMLKSTGNFLHRNFHREIYSPPISGHLMAITRHGINRQEVCCVFIFLCLLLLCLVDDFPTADNTNKFASLHDLFDERFLTSDSCKRCLDLYRFMKLTDSLNVLLLSSGGRADALLVRGDRRHSDGGGRPFRDGPRAWLVKYHVEVLF